MINGSGNQQVCNTRIMGRRQPSGPRSVALHIHKMILGENLKHVFQLHMNLNLNCILCRNANPSRSVSFVSDSAPILVSASFLILVSVLALGVARRPEVAIGSHLEANIGNKLFLIRIMFSQTLPKNNTFITLTNDK